MADVLGGWSLGLAWFAVLAGVYTYRQVHDDVQPGLLACIAIGVLVIFGSWSIAEHLQTDLARYSLTRRDTVLTPRHWTDGGWRALPGRRTELSGDEEEHLPLQWAVDSSAIAHSLESAGWQPAPAWSARSALLWLSPHTSVAALPVLQKLSEGNSAELTFVKFDARRPMNRLVLRLWRSRYRLAIGTRADDVTNTPIWYGALYQEAFQQPWHLVTLETSTTWPDASTIARLLPAGMSTLTPTAIDGGAVRHAVLVLPAAPGAAPYP